MGKRKNPAQSWLGGESRGLQGSPVPPQEGDAPQKLILHRGRGPWDSTIYQLSWSTGSVREPGLGAEGKFMSKPRQTGDEGCRRGTRRKERKIRGDMLWCAPLVHPAEMCCPLNVSVLCSIIRLHSSHSCIYFKEQAKMNGRPLV